MAYGGWCAREERPLIGQSKWGRAVTLVLCLLLVGRAGGAAGPVPGTTAPDFGLQTPSGERLTLSSLKGRVVVINFWNSG